jgi:hypothetical protein
MCNMQLLCPLAEPVTPLVKTPYLHRARSCSACTYMYVYVSTQSFPFAPPTVHTNSATIGDHEHVSLQITTNLMTVPNPTTWPCMHAIETLLLLQRVLYWLPHMVTTNARTQHSRQFGHQGRPLRNISNTEVSLEPIKHLIIARFVVDVNRLLICNSKACAAALANNRQP